MKESLKRRLNVFPKLRRRLSSVQWILLLITTAMFFLSAASNTCTFTFGNGGITGTPPTGPQASQTSVNIPPPVASPVPVPGGTPAAGGGTPAAGGGTPAAGGGTPAPPPGPPTGGTEVKVMMVTDTKNPSGFAFKDPTSGTDVTTIKKGTKVTWINATSIPHTVVSDDGKFKSSDPAKVIMQNQMYSVVFATAGTFKYHCSIHPPQVGTIIVQ